jgi:mannose-6-phosphate isomerase-like protein (cupin superfamily)
MSEPIVRREADCELESWADPVRGYVAWRTLFSGDRTPTAELTMGVAELPPGAGGPDNPHRHQQAEVYYILAGRGTVWVDGVTREVAAGTAVFIPGNAPHFARNTGVDVLRLLYVFAADAFDAVRYEFPQPDGSYGPS